ncbi:MAG: hypothetical protein PHQ42_03345 [Patescibacteria group bacterium]|nr:hypothetical protein [Patescibacteria group bacterium]
MQDRRGLLSVLGNNALEGDSCVIFHSLGNDGLEEISVGKDIMRGREKESAIFQKLFSRKGGGMANSWGLFSGNKSFSRISKKNRGINAVFFETDVIGILRKHLKPRGRGPAENTLLDEIEFGKERKFLAGLGAVVEFIGVPEKVVSIDGRECLKVRIILPEEGITAYCYSEVVTEDSGKECFCLQLAA